MTIETIDIESIVLEHGAHATRDEGMCALEAVAYIAGEPHSDHPECACPVIAAFMRNWNDALPADDRNRLLRPLIAQLVGTKSTPEVELQRSWMALDWLVRVHVPAWLSLVPSLQEHARALSLCVAIDGAAGLDAALPTLRAAQTSANAAWDAAWAAAWAAAWDAARDAAGDAAGAAAGDAAWDAAWAAAWAAARDAARDAAWAAAGAAAWAAARDAARDAARAALKPTTVALQASALELVARMIECGRAS